MIVTNAIRTKEDGTLLSGYYMDGYLMENLNGIPRYLERKFDVLGIVSGHGLVGVGKSTIAFQIGYYCAWMVAGGRMTVHRDKETGALVRDLMILPKKEVRFNLKENVVFKPEDLIDRAHELYEKYGPNQVIIYDEGRQGMDSRVMDVINEMMQDFFQKCRQMGHIILVVLPNFFKLHEDFAVARSLFLVDCYLDSKKNRGFFNFYNEVQKEWLFFLGKKKIGITQKYTAAPESFFGKFSAWMPWNEDEYNDLKQKSYKRKDISKRYKQQKKQRDAAIFLLKQETNWPNTKIGEEITKIAGGSLKEFAIRYILDAVANKQEYEE